jgi:hypothetical protein
MLNRRSGTIILSLGALGFGCGKSNNSSPSPDGGLNSTFPDSSSSSPDGSPSHQDGSPGTSTGKETGTTPPIEAGIEASGGARSDAGISASVLQHHLNITRDGHYIDSLMTKTYAMGMKFDTTFHGSSAGPGVPVPNAEGMGGALWGQPLYVENGVGGNGTYYVADDWNDIYAIDETTGDVVWSKLPLAEAAGQAGSGCGNISPVGVTGTPIIDLASRTMYLSAAIGIASGIQSHQIYALSIDDGTTVPGWPINVDNLKSAPPSSVTFNPPPQEERSALALVNGYLYVPYGGEEGDCGDYHGWIVSVPVADPAKVTAYATPAAKGGLWAVGGMASDGTDMFATTSNGESGGLTWENAESEAVMRFTNGTAFDPANTMNFFTPSNWQAMDDGDLDLGGCGPIVVDVPGATPSALIVQASKTGVVHLLNRANLGGIGTGNGTTGEGLYSQQVAPGGGNSGFRSAGAAFTTPTGTYVVFYSSGGNGMTCPGPAGALMALKINVTSPPTFTTVWCAPTSGAGSPIVTTTDAAGDNAIVWVVGAEGTNELYGWDAEASVIAKNGIAIFNGSGTGMDTVRHFNTPIDVKGRIIVGAIDKVYALTGM